RQAPFRFRIRSSPWAVQMAEAGLADKAANAAEEARRKRIVLEDFILDLGEFERRQGAFLGK
ncbi:MAG: hypothetical protein WCC96_06470, partial [Rhodomicrobium sp.]